MSVKKAPAKAKPKPSPVEDLLASQFLVSGIKGYQREVSFIPNRKFRADFWWPALKLDCEVDGAVWKGKVGGHTSGTGYTRDRYRDQIALAYGIVVVRFTSEQVRSGDALDFIKAYLPFRAREISRLATLHAEGGFHASLGENYGATAKT